jgi:DNA-binding IclR family transcriptional regulator
MYAITGSKEMVLHNQSYRSQQTPHVSRPDVSSPDEAGPDQLVHAVQRAVRILRCFSATEPEWSLADLVKSTGLRRTTVVRLAKTLEAEGLISLNPQTGRFTLGPLALDMAFVLTSKAVLARLATPHLERLAEITGASVGLTVWDGDGPLCIAHSPSPLPFRYVMAVGRRFQDPVNAHSKVLLAFGPRSRSVRHLSRPIEALTPLTVTDPKRLAEELEQVRREGVARDFQGHQLGVVAIGVPVRDCTGQVVASMNVVESEARFGPVEDKAYVQALKQVAADLSYDLGYREDSTSTTEQPDATGDESDPL